MYLMKSMMVNMLAPKNNPSIPPTSAETEKCQRGKRRQFWFCQSYAKQRVSIKNRRENVTRSSSAGYGCKVPLQIQSTPDTVAIWTAEKPAVFRKPAVYIGSHVKPRKSLFSVTLGKGGGGGHWAVLGVLLYYNTSPNKLQKSVGTGRYWGFYCTTTPHLISSKSHNQAPC